MENKLTQTEDFQVTDDKGRTVGARVATYEDVTATPSGPQRAFAFAPSATRAGKDFGAWSGERRYPSAGARDRAVVEYFAGARERATKQWARCAHGALPKTCRPCLEAIWAARDARRAAAK